MCCSPFIGLLGRICGCFVWGWPPNCDAHRLWGGAILFVNGLAKSLGERFSRGMAGFCQSGRVGQIVNEQSGSRWGRHRFNVADWLAQLQGKKLGPPELGAEPQFLLNCNYPRTVRRSPNSLVCARGYSYSRTRRRMASPNASRTLSMVIRSKTCWKKPATIMRVASLRVRPRELA